MSTMQEDIREGNELIALWMGAVKETPGFNRPYFRFDKRESYMDRYSYPIHALAYHSSWDWLMPVVEKIESIDQHVEDGGYSVFIQGHLCGIETMTGGDISSGFDPVKIKAVWSAVIQFIRWYNANQPR